MKGHLGHLCLFVPEPDYGTGPVVSGSKSSSAGCTSLLFFAVSLVFKLHTTIGIASRVVFLLTAFLAMTASRPAYAEAAPDALRERIEEWQILARNGDLTAQFSLGMAYSTGKGVRLDSFESVRWFRMAAEKGHREAQYNLGLALEKGRGVFMNYTEALLWYRRAALQDYAPAMNGIGMIFENGLGVPRNYRESFNWFWLSAEKGCVEGQYNLGSAYAKGRGTAPDYARAFKWYMLAAQQGYGPAQNSVGIMYQYGRGVPRDNNEAAKWYRLSAEQRQQAVQPNSGKPGESPDGAQPEMIEASLSVRREAMHKEAVAAYSHEKQHKTYVFDRKRVAAVSGRYPPKQKTSPAFAVPGRGGEAGKFPRLHTIVPGTVAHLPAVAERDAAIEENSHEKGHEMSSFSRKLRYESSGSYRPVSTQGVAALRRWSGKADEIRPGTKRTETAPHTPDSMASTLNTPVAKNTQLLPPRKRDVPSVKPDDVLMQFRSAAEKGSASAQYGMGLAFERGSGVPRDYLEAARRYRQAALQNHAAAQNNLGMMYKNGQGVPRDFTEALKWLLLSCRLGNGQALTNLGEMFENGQGVPRDYAEAVRYYRMAAARGAALAHFRLGVMYEYGRALPIDYAEAFRYYQIAARQGIAHAQYKLGEAYAAGRGVGQDGNRASEWYAKARKNGYRFRN